MIRLMDKNDLEQIIELENELFPENPWPESQFLYELNENPYAYIYVIEQEDKIVGYADLWIIYEQAQLANIAVASHMQGNGLGRQLMNQCVQHAIQENCENLTLEVRVSNQKAISLYEKSGFISVSIRKNYYENGEDAYLMIKPLGGLNNDATISD